MLQIDPAGSHIGGQITGVDVRDLELSDFEAIYNAWLQFGVVAIRGQELAIEQFVGFGRRFGTIDPHPSRSTRHPDYSEITVLGTDKFRPDGTLNEAVYKRGASSFHTDGAYDDRPFKATMLYALAVPSVGGDTYFSSMYMAFDALPDRVRQVLEGRRGAFTYGGRTGQHQLLNPEDRNQPPAFHPIIRTHGETGRQSLYFDPGKILYIEGLERQQSDALIEELTERMIVADAGYTHQWAVGDVVIWDNRCLVHKAAGDYPPDEDRIHWRVSIKEPQQGEQAELRQAVQGTRVRPATRSPMRSEANRP